jgi:hypothetical protein
MTDAKNNSFKPADSDHEARSALWSAICDAAAKLAGCCKVFMSRSKDPATLVRSGMPVPDVKTWQLVEALSLLAILIKADAIRSHEVANIFGATGPLHFIKDNRSWYLWAQPVLVGQDSALYGRPDILVTSTPDKPSSATASRLIECKCRRRLGAHDIRAEYGKAYDLRISSYLIWSFTTPSPQVISGAKRLGIDIEVLGFDTERRSDFTAIPESLVAHVANTQEVSWRENRFAHKLIESSSDFSRKILESS